MPLSTSLMVNLPENPISWIIWAVLLIIAFTLGAFITNKGEKFYRNRLLWLAALCFVSLFSSSILVFTIQLQVLNQVPKLTWLPLMCLPWMLGAGTVGVIPSMAIALGSGLLVTVFHAHDLNVAVLFVLLALFYNLLIGTRKYSNTAVPLRSSLIAALWLALITKGLLLAYLLILLPGSYIEKVNTGSPLFIYGVLEIIPSLLIGGLGCFLIENAISTQWTPLKYQRIRISHHPLDQSVSMVKSMIAGNYYQPIKKIPASGRAKVLITNLESLRDTLEKQNQTRAKLIGLEQISFNEKSFEELLPMILRGALRNEGSSARLVLYGKQLGHEKFEMRFRLGHGTKASLYAYLDEPIIEQLNHTPRLILSDIKADTLPNLKEGMPIPKALIALPLLSTNRKLGVLWVAFDQNKWFSEEDMVFYSTLVQRAALAISQSENVKSAQTERGQFTALINSLPDPILYFSLQGKLIFANTSARQVLPSQRLMNDGILIQEIFPGIDLEEWIKNPTPIPWTRSITLNGKQEYLLVIDAVSHDKRPSGYLCMLKAAADIHAGNAQKTELVANVSHDLRTPLTLMKGYATMLTNIGSLSDQQMMYVQRILGGIDLMNRLVSNVLNIERLDSGEGLKLTRVALKELIQEAVETMEMPALQKKLSFSIDLGNAKDFTLVADKVLLHQALVNIIDNAIKYSRLGGKMAINANNDGNCLRISIKDDGSGIAPLDLPRVFDRYYHAEGLDRSQNGFGLGLAIVKSIVEKHKGTVGVSSQLGKGSTFHIDLPYDMIEVG